MLLFLKNNIKHVDNYIEVSINKDDKMNYEADLELCEYNPICVSQQNELKLLAQMIEAPAMSFFQRLMKKIVVAHGTNS